MKVINDQRPIFNGQFIAFVTGLKSINTYPKYLRIGEVIDAKDYVIKELVNSKIWKVYPSNIITTGDDGIVQGVASQIVFTEKL